MTEEELEQEITKIIVTTGMHPQAHARLILEVLVKKGYHSPEECLQCQERESERKVDQQGLQEELDYWKHKYQWR